jgi:hypothetical protein
MTGGTLLCAVIIITVIEGIFSIAKIRKAWAYRKQRFLEQARGEFAEVRTALFQSMIEGKINAKSNVTKFVYMHFSYLVRNPDNFEAIARDYVSKMNMPKNKNGLEESIFIKEIETWPDESKMLFIKMADAMDRLVIFYAPIWIRGIVCALQFLLRNNIIRTLAKETIKRICEKTEQGKVVNEVKSLNNTLIPATC